VVVTQSSAREEMLANGGSLSHHHGGKGLVAITCTHNRVVPKELKCRAVDTNNSYIVHAYLNFHYL